MKIYNEYKIQTLTSTMQKELDNYRFLRNFDANQYIKDKTGILNQYCNRYNLNTLIVAVSGGIDSALSLSIVNHASKQVGSNIKNIIPVFLPAYNSLGVTGQKDAFYRAETLCNNLGLNLKSLDLSIFSENISHMVENSVGYSC